jgi:hypothetical protein
MRAFSFGGDIEHVPVSQPEVEGSVGKCITHFSGLRLTSAFQRKQGDNSVKQ